MEQALLPVDENEPALQLAQTLALAPEALPAAHAEHDPAMAFE